MSAKASGRRARRQTQLAARRERKRLSSQPQWVVALLLLVFLLSGAAGLIHEVVWMRLLAGVFGATSLAVSTVLAAFMGGLALGSYWIGRRMGQLSDRRRIYALLEIGIGVFALLVPFLLDLVEPLYGWLWRELELGFTVMSVFRFVLVGGLLLVPTAMMGATFPALADYFVGLEGKRLGPQLLYTVNLAGALLGVAAAGFVLMPVVGLWGAIAGGAILNIGVGLAVLGLPPLVQRQEPEAPLEDFQPRPDMLLLAAAFLSGVLSLAAQVAWTRVLILVVGSTTYAFSTVLVVYLLALAAGAAWVTWRWAAVVRVESHLAVIHVLMGLCMLGAIYSVNRLPFWYLDLFSKWQPESLTGVLALSTTIVVGVLIPPVLFAGMILPLVMVGAVPLQVRQAGMSVGIIYAVNTVGGILGAVVGGFVLIPLVGTQKTLLGVAVAGVIMGVVFAFKVRRRRWILGGALTAALAMMVGVILRPEWSAKPLNTAVFEMDRTRLRYGVDTVTRPSARVLYHREGPTATVMLLEDVGRRSLRINGRPNASDLPGDMSTQVLLSQIPLLLAPRVDKVMVVGFGSGVSTGSALQSPAKEITAVEIEPAVVEASYFFSHVNHSPTEDPRVRVYQDDVRHILRASPDKYDVIISGPSHPWVTGVASLFTEDFFKLARHRLASDGVFAHWLQAYQMAFDSYQSVLGAFHAAFPEVLVFRSTRAPGDSILIGSMRPLRLDLEELERRWWYPATREECARADIWAPEDLLSILYSDSESVRAFIKGAHTNTDNNMYVEFRAPKDMVLRPKGGIDEIFSRLERGLTHPENVLTDPSSLLENPERLRTLIAALERRKRPTKRYLELLAGL